MARLPRHFSAKRRKRCWQKIRRYTRSMFWRPRVPEHSYPADSPARFRRCLLLSLAVNSWQPTIHRLPVVQITLSKTFFETRLFDVDHDQVDRARENQGQ